MGSFGVTLAQKVFVVVSQARVLVVPAEHHASVVQSVMLQSTKPDIEMEGPVGLRDTRVSPEVRPNFQTEAGRRPRAIGRDDATPAVGKCCGCIERRRVERVGKVRQHRLVSSTALAGSSAAGAAARRLQPSRSHCGDAPASAAGLLAAASGPELAHCNATSELAAAAACTTSGQPRAEGRPCHQCPPGNACACGAPCGAWQRSAAQFHDIEDAWRDGSARALGLG